METHHILLNFSLQGFASYPCQTNHSLQGGFFVAKNILKIIKNFYKKVLTSIKKCVTIKTTNEREAIKMKEIKIGTRVKNTIGSILQCVSINDLMYEMKWVREDGSLSVGSVFYVPSHFKGLEILK